MRYKNIICAGFIGLFGVILSVGAYQTTDSKDIISDDYSYAGITSLLADAESQEIYIDHAQIYKTAQEGYYVAKWLAEVQRQLDEVKAQIEAERIEIESDSKIVHIPTNSYTILTGIAEVPNPELAPLEQPSFEKPATIIQPYEYGAEVTYKGLKTYMDYRTITATSSPQYALEHISDEYYMELNDIDSLDVEDSIKADKKANVPVPAKHIYTDNNGFRRIHCQNAYDSDYQERYVIALGSGITSKIGQYVDLIMENGEVIPCVLGDQKADVHTDLRNLMTSIHNPNNACASEFIVEADKIPALMIEKGDSSYALNLVGVKVEDIRVYNKNIFN